MMGKTHALSGAAGWLGLCAASPLAELHPTPVTVAAGAVVAAGAALAPDIDHPSSKVARSLGPVTCILARIVSYISDAVRDSTCGCCRTKGTHGHRTLTHTVLVAILSGVGLCLAGRHWGLGLAAGVVGVGAGLAVLGLLSGRGTWLTAAVAGLAAGVAVWWLGASLDWWWLGIPVGWGMLAHSLGDAATSQKAPLAYPIKIGGCRWRRIGLPDLLTFPTDGWVERRLVAPGLVAAGAVAVGVMVWNPHLAAAFDVGRQFYADVVVPSLA